MALALIAAVLAAVAAPTNDPAGTLQHPSGGEMAKYYPDAALRSGIDGDATAACRVDARGRLDHCQIEQEAPENLGFGSAALVLATRIRAPAAPGASTVVRYTVHFGARSGRVSLVEGSDPRPGVVWLAAPTVADVLAAYPAQPLSSSVAVFRCRFKPQGTLYECRAVIKSEADDKVEAAARPLLRLFRLRVDNDWAKDRLQVIVRIALIDPRGADAGAYHVAHPDWVATPDAAALDAAYPKQVADNGVTSGRAIVECRVTTDGALEACSPTAPDPLGFGEAAVKVAGAMRMNLWTAEGRPTVGGLVRLPIHFEQDLAAPRQ